MAKLQKSIFTTLTKKQMQKEEMYDEFYALITNLESDVSKIIKVNK